MPVQPAVCRLVHRSHPGKVWELGTARVPLSCPRESRESVAHLETRTGHRRGLALPGLQLSAPSHPGLGAATDWPSKEIASGHNGKGVDCSNFSSFVYNLGFGIKLNSDIRKQADRLAMSGPSAGQTLKAEKIKLPDAYLDFERTLRTGDLVFIRNQKGEISHVVIWVGSIGKSPKNTPLIIDSHGQGVKDSEGVAIPDGVQLRPFREKSWYFRNASHAHRIWKGP